MSGHGDTGGPKSRAGRRSVPIVAALRDLLVEHKLVTGLDAGLVFGSSATQPFTPTAVRKRALTAWRRVGLNPIGLHECRHTFASMLFAVGAKRKGDQYGDGALGRLPLEPPRGIGGRQVGRQAQAHL